MAKKKVTHTKSQSHDHNTLTPPTMDDPSVQIQNLKNLNSVLLKETTNHRQQIESLLHAKHDLQSALDRSAMDAETLISDKNLAVELEKGVLFVFAENQMREMGFRFDRLVRESNEMRNEVAVLKEQVSDLTIHLENDKLLLKTLKQERDQMKAEAENRERKAKEEAEKMRLETEKLFEEKREKERTIEELENDRVLALRNSQESAKVIDELKEKIEVMMRKKNETETLNTTQGMKILQLEHDMKELNEILKGLRNEEAQMRAKILDLEGSLGLAAEKEEEMANKNRELLREKEAMQLNIETLTEVKDGISRVLDTVQKDLENTRCELNEANRAKEEIEKVKVSRESEIVELKGETERLRVVVDILSERCRESGENNQQLISQIDIYRNTVDEAKLEKENMRKGFDEEKSKVESLELQVVEKEKTIEQLLSQVHHCRNAVDEVKLEKDSIREGLDEEKNKVKNLELQVAGMEEKFEHEMGKMRSERVEMNERNKKLERHVDVLMKEKDAIHSNLLEAQRECNDLRAKIISSCINSKQALEMLRSTAAIVGKGSAEEAVAKERKLEEEIQPYAEELAKERKLEEEIQPYAEELDAIRKAFKIKNEMVFDMKKQLVSLQKSVDEAHKGKSLWTGISSATTILAAALTAYIARGR